MIQNGEPIARWLLDRTGLQTQRVLSDCTDNQRQAVYRILSRMSSIDLQKLSGALEIEPLHKIADILTVISGLDHFAFYPDVCSERELGIYLVESGVMQFPDSALPYLDYEKIGTDYRCNHSGAYVDGGYVVREDEMKLQEPSTGRFCAFKVLLTHQKTTTSPCSLTLPADKEQLEAVRLFLGIDNLSQAHIVQVESPIPTLQQCATGANPSVEALNELANEIQVIYTDDEQLTDLRAILEAEAPETLAEVLEIIQAYDAYEVVQLQVECPGDYGRYLLYESNSPADDFDFKEEVRAFIDYEAYGRYKMDETGVRQTSYGWVRRPCDPFPSAELGMGMC